MILNVSVTRGSMKSGLLGSERLKIESRTLPVRRNMSKGISLMNGVADHATVVDGDNMVRQVNLVAAFHDHISCAKTADYLGGPGQEKMTLPCDCARRITCTPTAETQPRVWTTWMWRGYGRLCFFTRILFSISRSRYSRRTVRCDS
ncbi:unnamed protein product [Ixodes hexagonus]